MVRVGRGARVPRLTNGGPSTAAASTPIGPPHNRDFKYIPLLAVSDVVNQEPLNALALASPLYRPPKECVVAAANWFRYAYRAYLSQPRNVRQLYQLIKRNNVARIVEIGTSDLQRTVSLIEVAQRYAEGQKVFHTAVDGFDARPASLASLSIKEAHRVLNATGAAVRLVPGTPSGALSAVANSHRNTDLILISHIVTSDDLHGAWFYVPRMLHHKSAILREHQSADGPSYEWLTHSQIAEWAGRFGNRRAA